MRCQPEVVRAAARSYAAAPAGRQSTSPVPGGIASLSTAANTASPDTPAIRRNPDVPAHDEPVRTRILIGVWSIALTIIAAAAPDTAALPADGVRPVPGEVTSAYRPPARNWLPGHRGVDLATAPGGPVVAPADGVVSFAGTVVDRQLVSIRLSERLISSVAVVSLEPVAAVVVEGQRVRRGQLVGHQSPGAHCQDRCVHVSLRLDGRYANPMALLAAGVRLLPVGTQLQHTQAPPPMPVDGAWDRPAAGSPGTPTKPVQGVLSSPFGMRLHPVLGRWKLHDGLDLAAGCGTPVRSPWSGTVIRVVSHPGYGVRVLIDHSGGLRTAMNHLSSASVSAGKQVRKGEQVARVGTSGYSTGCHLHVMAWRDGQLMNPAQLGLG